MIRVWIAAALAALLAGGAAADALDRARERGALLFGHRLDAPPFSYRDAEGRPAGLAVRLCEIAAPLVAEAAGAPGLPVVWVPVTAATRFEALERGEIDLLCGPTTQTLTRRERLDFSIPYFVEGAGAVFRRGGPQRLADFAGEPVGVLGGTTTEKLVRRLAESGALRAEPRSFASHPEGLAALDRGEIEAYLADQSILAYQLGLLRPATPLILGAETHSREPYALTMLRGESRIRLAVDRALSRLYESGAMIEVIRETLGRAPEGPEVQAIFDVVAIPE